MVTTQPSARSAPAVYLSNAKDIVGIWMASHLAQTDTADHGPGLCELHFFGAHATGWPISQIVDYNGTFRDETGGQLYTEAANFDSDAWISNNPASAGTLVTRYLSYSGAAVQPRCDITRSYAAVPQQPFLVIRYTLANTTAGDLTFSVLDQARCNNVAAGSPPVPVHGYYDAGRNALVADMTATGQNVLVLGAFAAMDGHQVGDDADTDPASPSVSGTITFAATGQLAGNGDLEASQVNLAFARTLSIPAGGSASIDMYLVVQADLATALAAADTARADTADGWFSATAIATAGWLSNGGRGRRPAVPDSGMVDAYERALIMIKNMQHPVLGTIAASSNPYRYGHKNWVRDGAVTAIALDAAGHHTEAELYWRWMASVQGSDGTWKTTYDFWTGAYISFVEPEYDSIGAFCYGVYRHYQATGNATFLADLWPSVKRAADWILSSISPANGFGAADFSIWEEPERGLQHNSYTQAWYVAGLWATQQLAEARGDTADADLYAGGPGSIVSALQRPSTWLPPGSWNPAGYYNRGVNSDNSPAPLEDTSSNALIALGVIDHRSGRARSHIATMTSLLTKNRYGLARYQGDVYYHTSPFDPAGDEVGGPEPAWPQMSMWVAAYESLGDRQAALHRMQWFVSTTGAGYMPQGEAVSNITSLSVLSSMSEPLTAASYVLAALSLLGTSDLRIRPPISNAGTFKQLAVAPGAAGDDLGWQNVPYFVGGGKARGRRPQTTIGRVYLANDGGMLHVRIDNAAGALPAFGAEPAFAIRLYSSDFAGQATEVVRWGLERSPLNRAFSYAVERRSTEDRFRRWAVVNANWQDQPDIGGVTEPQWNPATGRIEVGVPLAALSSTAPAAGAAWATLAISLASQDAPANAWAEADHLLIHYRLSTADQQWIYGDIEQ
jgi:hypothetical protein